MTEQGYTLHTCSVCGSSYKDNYTDKLNPVDPDAPQIVVDKATANTGNDVVVNISLKNNPGIVGFRFSIKYDTNALTLKSAEGVDMDVMFSENLTDYPFVASWESGTKEIDTNEAVVKLTFTVKENTSEGIYPITVEIDDDDFYNIKEENIKFEVVNGAITVRSYLPGDINNDGKVNMKDLTRLHQYINGWKVTVVQEAIDVNGDGKVNMKDLTRLHQYINGWKVEIH